MELKSTASFKDVDVDAMLEHTTFDDFMRGLYSSRVARTATSGKKDESPKSEFEQMWDSVMAGDQEETAELNLKFGEEEAKVENEFEVNVL